MFDRKTPTQVRGQSLALAASMAALSALAFIAMGCGHDGGGQDSAGDACEVADHCYAEIEADELAGEALCLDRVEGGYCTHTCQTDADCCAAAGECPNDRPQVCAPFESTGMMMCFLSCESDDVEDDFDGDVDDYCREYSNDAFTCRSTGGGSNNRKVCS